MAAAAAKKGSWGGLISYLNKREDRPLSGESSSVGGGKRKIRGLPRSADGGFFSYLKKGGSHVGLGLKKIAFSSSKERRSAKRNQAGGDGRKSVVGAAAGRRGGKASPSTCSESTRKKRTSSSGERDDEIDLPTYGARGAVRFVPRGEKKQEGRSPSKGGGTMTQIWALTGILSE